jgi:hypothetical protein
VIRKFLFVTAICLWASAANGQEAKPAGQRGKVSGFFHYTGRHVKETFTDCKTDKLWCFYVVGTIALNGIDTGTTIHGQRCCNLREANPLLPSHPSAPGLISISAVATLAQLGSVHMLRELFTDSCKRDAANPNSKWRKVDARTYNPETCKYGVDLAGMAEWPYHATIVKSNFDLMTPSAPRKQ